MAKILLIKNAVIPRDYSGMVSALQNAGHTVDEKSVATATETQTIADELKKTPESYDLTIVGDIGRAPDGGTITSDVTRFSPQISAITQKPVIVIDDLSTIDKAGLPDGMKSFSMNSHPGAVVMAVQEVLKPSRNRIEETLVR